MCGYEFESTSGGRRSKAVRKHKLGGIGSEMKTGYAERHALPALPPADGLFGSSHSRCQSSNHHRPRRPQRSALPRSRVLTILDSVDGLASTHLTNSPAIWKCLWPSPVFPAVPLLSQIRCGRGHRSCRALRHRSTRRPSQYQGHTRMHRMNQRAQARQYTLSAQAKATPIAPRLAIPIAHSTLMAAVPAMRVS